MADRSESGGVSRRQTLRRAAGAIVVTGFFSGCTADVGADLPPNEHWPITDTVPDLPIQRQTDELARNIEATVGEDIDDIERFEEALAGHDIEFASVERSDVLFELVFVETAARRTGILSVIGLITGGFTALVDAGFDARSLELTVLVPDRSTVGVTEIASEWAQRFNEGALSASEYGELVAGTIESRRRPPTLDIAPDE